MDSRSPSMTPSNSYSTPSSGASTPRMGRGDDRHLPLSSTMLYAQTPDSASNGTEGQSNLRNRQPYPGSFPTEPASPTSTLMSSDGGGMPSLFRAYSSHRPSTPRMTPRRTIVIRSDPNMVSSFDPADKELYELWAPTNTP